MKLKLMHTPGPWVGVAQGDANEWCILTHDKQWIIALRQNGELLSSQELANIQLIKAAPDLLEAALTAFKYIEYIATNDANNELALLYNAIQKAVGQQGNENFRID